MFYLTDKKDESHDPRLPLPVDTMGAELAFSYSDTLTYNGKAVAGTIAICGLSYRNILNPEGDQIGSYWGNPDNFVYGSHEPSSGVPIKNRNLVSVTETNGSAACVINDIDNDLEKMFESLTTTVKRYVLKVYDTTGASLYGWIMGVAASGNAYTFDIYNARVDESAQNWVGTLASFDNTSLAKVEIYRYQNSIAFGTGTTFTEEVGYPNEYTKDWRGQLEAAQSLSSGQFFVDYQRGRLIGKRADTTASETVTYLVEANANATPTGLSSSVDVTKLGGQSVDTGAGNIGDATQRVTLATDDANLATINTNSGTIAGDTTSIDGKITACNTGAVVVSTNVSAIQGPGNPTIDSYGQVAINLTTGANQVLVSSAASKQIWVYGVTLTCGDADGQTVSFQDEDDTAITGIMEFKQYGGMAHSPSGNFAMPLWKLATDKDLEIDITGGDVDGFLTYAIVSV